ncbi:hypothetical protein [uncultured Desulfovibrio sp.]|uniref:hypothetical protein n=1 Tax=uncultured Desulfovibrio sp. TaxID=167968 RepID=UPI00263972C7|nr:hypothetical protein [uncultured Desulfovibrio sp.]
MKRISPAVWLKIALLVALLLLPLRMGEGANAGVPVIGAAEQLAADYCGRTLERATAAYVSAKVVDKTISMIQRAEISVTPIGVGLTFAPGELLAAANEAIERVSAALFSVMGLMLVEKLSIGLISWLCFKLLLPLALVLSLLRHLTGGRLPQLAPVARFLARLAVLLWCFFPAVALAAGYVESAYLDAEYARQMDENAGEEKRLDALGKEFAESVPEDQSLLDRLKEAADMLDVRQTAADMLDYADRMTDRLFHVFCIFLLTTVLIPLFMLFLLLKLLALLTDDYRREMTHTA